jgi:RNA polymerase-binding transcription factor DksA
MLLTLRTRLTEGQSQLKEEVFRTTGGETGGGSSDVPVHPGSHADEREVSLTLWQNEEHLLAEVEAALVRLDKGTFGRCESCGRAITAARLQVVPYARFCVGCARQREEAAQ